MVGSWCLARISQAINRLRPGDIQMKTILIADEVDLEWDEPEDGCVEVSIDGLWYVDESRLKAFADRLAELIIEYQV